MHAGCRRFFDPEMPIFMWPAYLGAVGCYGMIVGVVLDMIVQRTTYLEAFFVVPGAVLCAISVAVVAVQVSYLLAAELCRDRRSA